MGTVEPMLTDYQPDVMRRKDGRPHSAAARVPSHAVICIGTHAAFETKCGRACAFRFGMSRGSSEDTIYAQVERMCPKLMHGVARSVRRKSGRARRKFRRGLSKFDGSQPQVWSTTLILIMPLSWHLPHHHHTTTSPSSHPPPPPPRARLAIGHASMTDIIFGRLRLHVHLRLCGHTAAVGCAQCICELGREGSGEKLRGGLGSPRRYWPGRRRNQRGGDRELEDACSPVVIRLYSGVSAIEDDEEPRDDL